MREGCPAFAVEKGISREQRVVWRTVKELADAIERGQPLSSTLTFVGEAVALAPG